MTKTRLSTKIISGALSTALAFLSFAIPAAPALGAELGAAPTIGLPAGGWTPVIANLANPANLSRFNGVAIQGVDVPELLANMGRVNMLPSPALAKLGELPKGASEAQIVAALAAAAAETRASAAQALADLKTGIPAARLVAMRGTLLNASLSSSLLTPEQRAQVPAAAAEVSREIAKTTSSNIDRLVKVGVSGWSKTVETTEVAGSESSITPRLERSIGFVGTRESAVGRRMQKVTVTQTKTVTTTSSFDWKKFLRITALAVALPVAVFALPQMSPVALIVAVGVMGSVVAHEAAHLFVLRRLGDDTSTKQNFSANPFKLIDPVGTVAVPVITSAIGAAFGLPVLFGWAKPVPVDFNKLADPKKDTLKVSIAGPAMNAVLAGAAFAALALFHPAGVAAASLLALGKINVVLAVFNMLPFSPQMDGFKVMIGLLPDHLYKKWTENKRLPEDYRSTFSKLYEGPSAALNAVGMDSQGRVNFVTRAITFVAFGAVALAAHAFIGAPLLLLALVCSYDYYCIREKIQNEEAVKKLIPIMQGIGSAIARVAEEDESIQSQINTEEIEHAMKNVFEDMLDKVIDSKGFSELSNDEKWARFEEAYLEAAVDSLSRKGMSKDSKDKIRETLRHGYVREYLDKLRGWVEQEDVWRKWHSPNKKKKGQSGEAKKDKKMSLGGSGTMGLLAFALIGASMLAPHGVGMALGTAGMGLMIGSITQKRPKPFKEALEELRLSDKELAAMIMLLKDMTLSEKPPLSGRIDELSRAYSGVTGPRGIKESVALVGKPGTGKTAIVEKLAQATVMGQTHEGALSLKKMEGRYVIEVNSTRLMRQEDPAGTLEAVIDILTKLNEEDPRAGNKVILFLDEAHVLFDGEKGKHVANTLKKPVRDGAVSIILATTLDEYKKYVEPDEALKRRFPAIFVDESSVDETLRALENASAWYEQRFGVKVDPSALKAAAELAPKFNHEEYLPGSAFTYFENAVKWADFDLRRDLVALAIADKISDLQYAMKKLKENLQKTDRVTENLKKDEPTTVEFYNLAIKLSQELVELYKEQAGIPADGKPVVDGELVGMAISRETGIKSGQLTLGGEPIEKYLKMEEEVGKRVIGQPDAISAIARSVRQNKAGLSDPKRPLGVYYLTGPTGSGKTHLAKELARFLFDDPEAVVRVDMSEYMESHSVAKFIGSPPGYVGFESGGQLTEAVRKKPYSVVLFDEIEKAHPQVWLMMLQILGEGRLTDGQGKTTSFKNTIILMTSNLGMHAVDVEPYVKAFEELRAQEKAAAGDRIALRELEQKKLELAENLSQETKAATQVITAQAFKETYPPEFEGRLSAPPIVFNRITPAMALQIAELNLKELRGVLGYAGHEFAWTPGVVKKIVDEGFSVRLGARPLQNAIDRFITQNIATEILKTAMANGGKVGASRIEAVLGEDGEIKLNIKSLPPKQVKKGEAQGAAKELFTTVLEQTLTAAADSAAPAPTLKLIDEWVKAALAANPETTASEAAPAAEEPAAQAETPVDAAQVARPAAPAPAAKPGLLTIGADSPLSAGARSVSAANNDPELKDANVRQAAAAIKEAMAGYPEAAREAIVRSIEDQNDPYVGWLKIFIEQAKRNGGGNPTVKYEINDQAARVAIARTGALSTREKDLLTRHFTGLAPLDAAQARTRAETWNVQDSGSGMRLMLDLHRILAKIPGAKLGVEVTAGGVEYWIEIPKPQAPPPAPVEPTPPPTAAEATPPAATPTTPAAPLVSQAGGAAQWSGDAHPASHATSQMGLSDQLIKAQATALKLKMTELAYSGEARGAAVLFLAKVADFMKGTAQEGESVQSRWSADGNGFQLQVSRNDHRFSEAEIERLKTLIESSTELKAKIEAAGGRIYYGSGELSHGGTGASVWLQLPHTGPVSQADGQAEAASEAGRAPVSEAARAKLKTIGYDPEKPGTIWVTFEGSSNILLQPIIDRGFTNAETNASSGGLRRAKLVGPDAAAAGRAAAWLAGDPKVRTIGLHPDALAVVEPAPSFDVNALLQKIRAAVQAGSDPRVMWAEITAESPDAVLRDLRAQGFEVPVIRYEDGFKRAQLIAPSAAAAARAAIVLAAREDVRLVEVHPQARSLIRTTETSDPTTTPEGWLSVELDRLAPNDEDTELANAKRTIANAARGSEQAKAALEKFIDEAARKAKNGSENGDKIYLEWSVLPDQLEVSIRRKGGPVNPLAWTGWAAAAPFVAELSTANGVVAVEGGRTGGRFTLTLPMPRATSGARPVSGAPAMRATPEFKAQMVTLMRELIRQGAQRGLALRYTASEIVAEASSRADMDWTADWLRFASDPEVHSVNEDHGPQVAAAGMVVAKHGSRSQDEQRLIAAMKKFQSGDSWDHARPARTRLIRSLAKLLTPGNDRQLQELIERYDRQKQSNLSSSERLHADVVLAMQTALYRNAGRDQFDKLVTRDWNRRLIAETYDYVKRVNPDYLRRIYDDWKAGRTVEGVRRLLALWAIADHGDRADMAAVMTAVREDRWLGSSVSLEEKNFFGEALGRMAQRIGYDDALKHDARLWLREGMGTGGSYLRMVTAVQIAGAVGDHEDMPYLERVFRTNPGSGVSFEHEMTQMEATVAWGKIAQREGLVPEYWSTKQNPNDPNSLPLLQEWLTDTNSGVNMAAAEALLQFIKHGSPARAAQADAPRAQGSRAPADHPFLRMGPPDMPGGDERTVTEAPSDAALPYARLSDANKDLAHQWMNAFGHIARAILGFDFERQIRMSQNTTAGAVVFALRQTGETAIQTAHINELRQLVLLLLNIARDPQEVRERKLEELASRFVQIRQAYEALSGLMNQAGVSMGINPDASIAGQPAKAELWLKFDVTGRPAAPRRTSFNAAHRHMVGDDDGDEIPF